MQELSLHDGKNLPFFMFLYTLGDCLRHLEEKMKKVSLSCLISLWLLLNMVLVVSYIITDGSFVGNIIWLLSYQYCGPLLVISAVLFFLIFSKIHFKSMLVNSLAGSVFAVYIIHHQHYIMEYILRPVVMNAYSFNNTPVILLLMIILIACAVMAVSIGIDKLFNPIWRKITKYVVSHEEKIMNYLTGDRCFVKQQ